MHSLHLANVQQVLRNPATFPKFKDRFSWSLVEKLLGNNVVVANGDTWKR